MLPLDDESSAALKGKQVEYYTEDYIYGVGRGGIKYMKYNYSDKEWKEFVAQGKPFTHIVAPFPSVKFSKETKFKFIP